jgi:hypothetical protein
MTYKISKLLLAEHAAFIGQQKRCKEVIVESVSTQDCPNFHKNNKTQQTERKLKAKILSEEAAKYFECRHADEMCESSDDDSLLSAAFSTKAWKNPINKDDDIDATYYESCIEKLLDDGIDSEDESFYLNEATHLLKSRKL